MVNKIYKYAEKNSQVNFFDYKSGNLIYEKRKLMTEEQKDNMLKVCAMVINVITLVICSISHYVIILQVTKIILNGNILSFIVWEWMK